jgi:hypothetical protein
VSGFGNQERVMRRLVLVALGVTGCTSVHTDALHTGPVFEPYRGAVEVRLLAGPPGEEVGLVQVSGPHTVAELMPEFKAAVAELGGNLGVVDEAKGWFDVYTSSEVYAYECGTKQVPRTCQGTKVLRKEVLTVRLLGRAFRSCGGSQCLPQ